MLPRTPLITRECDLHALLAAGTIGDDVAILLDEVSVEDATKLTEALASLASRVNIPRFSLWICFTASSTASAKIVIDGLRVFQGLKDVALVLGRGPPTSASKMAGAAVRSLQESPRKPEQSPQRSQPLTLTDLPREIRHAIIDHVINDDHKQSATLLAEEPEGWQACCTFCLPYEVKSLHRRCACPRIVSADSTICRCHANRLTLFRVNKMLHADSSYIFFSTNRVNLRDLKTALRFLSNTSHANLHAIRKLDIRIRPNEYNLFFTQPPDQFTQIINTISTKCNLPRLHLSINSAGDDVEIDIWPAEDLRLIPQMRANIVTTLKSLHSLDRLDIYLSGAKPEDEDRMEKEVMGDDYDAIARGKRHMYNRDPLSVHNEYPALDTYMESACEYWLDTGDDDL